MAGGPALRAGDELGPWTVEEIEQEPVAELATLLDDPNPIHLSPEAARAAGLGERPVIQGPASMAFVVNMLREAVPGARLAGLRVRLLANVCVGDGIVAAGRVVSVEPEGESGGGETGERVRIACAVWLDVAGGPRALEGTATLVSAA